ncbi:MAG TPA: LLM class F420-dependent oxidoreductase [Acidimicrobiales bacterium]|nr:LLM class F420-dependent oxidoreductase [Acidimicrobiales bacterium]
MQLRIFTEPQQGASYEHLLAVASCAEECGYDAFFRSDHYLRMGDGDPRPGPTDAWTTLAGLARDTSRIRLGTLLTAATFRLPGVLAVIVAQVDTMSRGRVELGLGAGWFEDEHLAFGIPFPPSIRERFDRLEEQLQIVTGMWATGEADRFSFSGNHYELVANMGLPKAVQAPHPPIIVGGVGTRRTPAIAARFADECNVPFSSVQHCAKVYAELDAACERIGRDPSTIKRSAALVVCAGRNDEEISRRAAAIGREVEELREHGATGSATEVAERLRSYGETGATRIYLQILDLSDLDHLRFIAEEVAPLLGATDGPA